MVRFSFLPSTAGDAGTGAEQSVVPEQPLRPQFDQTLPAKQADQETDKQNIGILQQKAKCPGRIRPNFGCGCH